MDIFEVSAIINGLHTAFDDSLFLVKHVIEYTAMNCHSESERQTSKQIDKNIAYQCYYTIKYTTVFNKPT